MKIKKLIIILVIVAVILGGILLVMLNYQKQGGKNLAAESTEIPAQINNTIQEVDVRNNFYVVKTCIGKFYAYYSDIFKDPMEDYLIKPDNIDSEKIQKNRAEKVYQMIDDEYLNFKGITQENIADKLPKINELTINIEKMYVIEKEDAISLYFAYGKTIDSSDLRVDDFSIMVKMDMKNRTFKILLKDYLENFYKDIHVGQSIEINEKELKKETYNTFTFRNITDEEYVNDLFTHYQNILKTSKENTYNILDEEYKKQNFTNLEDYLTYINLNYSKITMSKLDLYSKKNYSDYTQYIFKDIDEEYYIFEETAPFQYKVMLDNYSIPTEDFTEQYGQSSEAEKVVLNIKRFFMGIDDKNYGYSYSVLSESFKNNKYPTKNEFINYVKQNFFEENEIEYITYEKENGVYIYKIKIKDATGKSTEEKALNIILRLKDGTDFEMSFGE